MTKGYNCPYGRTCSDYEHETFKCCFFYNFCKQNKIFRESKESKLKNNLLDLKNEKY